MADEKCQNEDSEVRYSRPHGQELSQRRFSLFFDDEEGAQAKGEHNKGKIEQLQKPHRKTLSIVQGSLQSSQELSSLQSRIQSRIQVSRRANDRLRELQNRDCQITALCLSLLGCCPDCGLQQSTGPESPLAKPTDVTASINVSAGLVIRGEVSAVYFGRMAQSVSPPPAPSDSRK